MNTYNMDKMYNSYSSDMERMQNTIKDLQQENQELKLELSGYRQAILDDKEMLGLKEKNQKYKEVIDKAIEFIYAHSSMEPPYYEFREFYNVSNLSELLDILKEVE